ncbi:hypothetical protein CMUST_02265 [Corynebacterium mustelae]|uniref:Uncharacterized protein n=1 Tax=Corynebacterium mustelae TaxID=571915 RepID=A0A0G3H139_9CORY|nr:DUF6138 family protein [Corynebacterium mustelae]AKK04797.1 hypothetical protein CMUST_02265 [Corynebacterium mustelae]
MPGNDQDQLSFDDCTDPMVIDIFTSVLEQLRLGHLDHGDITTEHPTSIHYKDFRIPVRKLLTFALHTMDVGSITTANEWDMVDKLRELVGWNTISGPIRNWLTRHLTKPYFPASQNPYAVSTWHPKPEVDLTEVPHELLEFACAVAVADIRYSSPSSRQYAEMLLSQATALGSDTPYRLFETGSGDLPENVASSAGDGWYGQANDVSGIISVTVTQEDPRAYRAVLEYLIHVVSCPLFPNSYSIDFTGPTKNYLPIPYLETNSIDQLFQCAAHYPELFDIIADYARTAMREYEWYLGLEDHNRAMPGTFAVFALGLYDATAAALVNDYMELCDDERQEVHALFVAAAIDRNGYNATTIEYLVRCLENCPIEPELSEMTDQTPGADALEILNEVEASVDEYLWERIHYSIWGE